MGFLAPLYALAALAIAGPIVLHLIRRQPKGRQPFSSLMFLQPSPPRITRRSRLDNLLLLALRALAILLIALAFARPFLRNSALVPEELAGRTVVVLLDTSASMQRSEVWTKAKQLVVELVETLSPTDRVGLYAIDTEFQPVVPLENEANSMQVDNATQQRTVRDALAQLQPSWRATELAKHLMNAADMLQAKSIVDGKIVTTSAEIVLVTDLHENSGLEALQGFPWPENVRLDVRRAAPTKPGNARVSIMQAAEQNATEDDLVRVRIENNADSVESNFRLSWHGMAGAPQATAETHIQVPPGQVRVIPMPTRPAGANRVALSGDLQDFDNNALLPITEPLVERLLYIGTERLRQEEDPYYFLSKAPLSTPFRTLNMERTSPGKFDQAQLDRWLADASLSAVVVETGVDDNVLASLVKFCRAGRTLIYVASQPVDEQSKYTRELQALTGTDDVQVLEAKLKDFALLGVIDFQSSLFKPFADVRFSDFSKIRFWSHRQITSEKLISGDDPAWKVLAKFDNGAPMIVHQRTGDGNLWIIASGWQVTASQLGLSSKFVPLLAGMLDPAGRTRFIQSVYQVGEPIVAEDVAELKVQKSEGVVVEHKLVDGHIELETPGLFWLVDGHARRQIAVQIPESESQLAEVGLERFEQYGVRLGKVTSDVQRREVARQLQTAELESRQKVWQWLLFAGIIVLVIETALAGWSSRRGISSGQSDLQTAI